MRVFHRVVQLGSMAAAARACHLSEPAVTHAIASLENSFAARLLERSSKGAVPTAAGEAVSKGFQRVLEEIDEAVAQIRRKANGGSADAGRYVRMSQLRALFAVVEHGGFRAALKVRGIRTSRLYCATRELEEALSVTLFEKTSTGRSPTRDARRFATRCRRALLHLEQLRAEIARHLRYPLPPGAALLSRRQGGL
jgi:DNA-binding transcriptional LysR family regulator